MKELLVFYSNVFRRNKHISFLSLICKMKEADSFPCPLREKVSFPLNIPHTEKVLCLEKQRIPGSTLMCRDNYQAWNISEK